MVSDFYFKGNTIEVSPINPESISKSNSIEDKMTYSAINAEYFSKGNMPDDKIIMILESLTKDKSNTVFIVTGREKKLVNEWFSSIIKIKKYRRSKSRSRFRTWLFLQT